MLLAHRFGSDEAGWPAAEDRYASDLLLADAIADPWLRALTASARDATIPVVLGGHSLVGPGLRLVAPRNSPMDLRREPPRPLDETSDPALLAAIRDEIRRDGPMSFARFMEIALYDPDSGYYRSARARPGRGGDFLTAPEADPIFGRAIARFAGAVHAAIGSPPTFPIREYGAGEGALAAPLVDALLDPVDPTSPAPVVIRYLVDEVEPRRVAAVRGRIAALGPAVAGRVVVEPDDGAAIDGLAIANEVLDALPTARVVGRGDRLREVRVGLGDDGQARRRRR